MKDTDPPNAEIKPVPFKVPLTLEDVPPGSVIRPAGQKEWNLINRADEDGVDCHHWCNFLYKDMMRMEIKRPGEDWVPAFKWDEAV